MNVIHQNGADFLTITIKQTQNTKFRRYSSMDVPNTTQKKHYTQS